MKRKSIPLTIPDSISNTIENQVHEQSNYKEEKEEKKTKRKSWPIQHTNLAKIRKKLKGKKRILTLTGLVTISGILNTPHPVKTSSHIVYGKKEERYPEEWQIRISALKEYMRLKNPQVPIGEDERLAYTIIREYQNLRLPPTAQIDREKVDPFIFLVAMIETESTFNKHAISQANARGYMQLMPTTALWLKKKQYLNFSLSEIHSTEINVMLGVKYLNYLSTQFYDLKWICLAYNAGDGNVRRGVYNIRYWNKVKSFYREFKQFVETYKKNQNVSIRI